MKAVLDANIGLKWVLNEPDSVAARQVRREFINDEHMFIAPDTFVAEVCHALTRAERKRIIQISDGEILLSDILSTPPVLHSYLPLVNRSMEISSEMRHSVHDCFLIALAEHESCELLTADEKLVAKFRKDFPFIVSLSEL